MSSGADAVASGGAASSGGGSGDIARTNPLTGQPFSQKYYTIKEKREALPVWKYLEDIGEQLQKSQIVIIEGETGSGKTTQVRCGN
jgi:HrpA-like RNA helicase